MSDFLRELRERYFAVPAAHTFTSERLFVQMAGEFFLLNGWNERAEKNFQVFLRGGEVTTVPLWMTKHANH